MQTILHLSDLHFGTERPGIISELTKDIQQLQPDIIVISGDFTQRARLSQYKQAQMFIRNLNCKKLICVPGNHDIALYNIIERFFYPYRKYKKIINPLLSLGFYNQQLAILGINSVTPYKAMSGYVSEPQLEEVKTFFKDVPTSAKRIVVMHHNLIHSDRHKVINDVDHIIDVFIENKVNMVLCGHIHFPYLEQVRKQLQGLKLYVITAGTAISTRTAAPNSYNILKITNNDFTFIVREYHHSQFSLTKQEQFSF